MGEFQASYVKKTEELKNRKKQKNPHSGKPRKPNHHEGGGVIKDELRPQRKKVLGL